MTLARAAPKVRKYSAVTGFFVQDDPSFDAHNHDVLTSCFGLIDKSSSRWSNLLQAVAKLNAESPPTESYRIVFHARHGQGNHNVAEAKYGVPEWDAKWSLLDGDGEMVWGPDPVLTPIGVGQAVSAHEAWKIELAAGAPLPQVLYSSPFRRSLSTLEITWRGILLRESGGLAPIVREGLRERLGEHTCDKRSERSSLMEAYPDFFFDDSVTEEDTLWTMHRETVAEHIPRVQIALDEIFETDTNEVIYLATHSGVIQAFFGVLGLKDHFVPPGGFVPFVLKIDSA